MIVEAVVGNVCVVASLNCVEVIVRFQPPPEASPRASTTITPKVYGVVWSEPFSVRLNVGGGPLGATESVAPPVTTAVTVIVSVVAARAAATASRAAATTSIAISAVFVISTRIIVPDRGAGRGKG